MAEDDEDALAAGKKTLYFLIPLVFGVFVLFVLWEFASEGSSGFLDDVVRQQPLVTIGTPLAALASLCLVLLLRTTSGPIEFEGLGFKFKGASGPIVMWVFCFLAMTVALKLLWV